MSTPAMPTLTAHPAPQGTAVPELKSETLRRALLISGIVSSLYYVGVNVYVPTQWEGYSVTSQAVSELSAIGAPTRALWVQLLIPYTILIIAFGWGIWMSGGGIRAVRAIGALFVADGVVGAFWPPMHPRGAETSLTDTLHIVWTGGWLLIMLVAMGLAVVSLGKRFGLYTIATLLVFIVFGTLTSLEGPRIAQDLPTPWIGLWERINMGAAMIWVAVLGFVLLRRPVAAGRAP